jgi:hypothetical protein
MTMIGVIAINPRPAKSRSNAESKRGTVMPKKPSLFRPSTSWPVRPGKSTASL